MRIYFSTLIIYISFKNSYRPTDRHFHVEKHFFPVPNACILKKRSVVCPSWSYVSPHMVQGEGGGGGACWWTSLSACCCWWWMNHHTHTFTASSLPNELDRTSSIDNGTRGLTERGSGFESHTIFRVERKTERERKKERLTGPTTFFVGSNRNLDSFLI